MVICTKSRPAGSTSSALFFYPAEPTGRLEPGQDGIAEVGEDDEEFQRAIQLSLEEQQRPQLPPGVQRAWR